MCSLAAIVFAASAVVAQADGQPPNKKAPVPKELQELSVLVGDWAGIGTMDGKPFTFYSSHKWTLGGHFLEVTQTVLDAHKSVTSTRRQLVGWDARKRKLVWCKFYSNGSYVRASGVNRDSEIVFDGCQVSVDGKKRQHEGTVTLAGRNKWKYEIVIRSEGEDNPAVCRGEATRVQKLPALPKEDDAKPRKELKSLEPEIRQWTNWTKTQPWRASYCWTLRHTILQVDTPLGKDTAQMLIGWNPEKSRAAYWWFDSTGNVVGPALTWHMPIR